MSFSLVDEARFPEPGKIARFVCTRLAAHSATQWVRCQRGGDYGIVPNAGAHMMS